MRNIFYYYSINGNKIYKNKLLFFKILSNVSYIYYLFYYISLKYIKIVRYSRLRIYFFFKLCNKKYNEFVNISEYDYSLEKKLCFLYIYFKNSWITYRYFFGYSKFNRTRSNSKSVKSLSIYFRKLLLDIFLTKYYKIFSYRNKLKAIYLEFFNKLWYFQWNYIWNRAHIFFISFVKSRGKRSKFGSKFALKNKAFTFIKKKLKLNKKKVVLPTNIFNIGFYFRFTSIIKRSAIRRKKRLKLKRKLLKYRLSKLKRN